MTLYGFSTANNSDKPAWFHSEAAAQRFAAACGWEDAESEIADSDEVDDEDIMDTPETPWSAKYYAIISTSTGTAFGFGLTRDEAWTDSLQWGVEEINQEGYSACEITQSSYEDIKAGDPEAVEYVDGCSLMMLRQRAEADAIEEEED
jgi:hypothetical protein